MNTAFLHAAKFAACFACFCGHTETGVITATSHSYKPVVTEPTCTEEGFTTHTCSVCNHSYADSKTDALGHDMSDWVSPIPAPTTPTRRALQTRSSPTAVT